MLVRYFMSSPVHSVDPYQEAGHVLADLRRRGIRRAPVAEDGELVGIVSEGDLRAAVPSTIGQLERGETRTGDGPLIGELMTRSPFCVSPNDSMAHAARIMIREKVGGLPVLRWGRLVGIVTESDLFRAFAQIFDSVQGTRILIREPSESPGRSVMDYAAICVDHGLKLENLLQHRINDGDRQTFLTVSGDDVDGFVQTARESKIPVLKVIRPASSEGEPAEGPQPSEPSPLGLS